MSFNLSLATKGLMLVSIPVCFEIGFVWGLVTLQHETEVQAEQAVKYREIEHRLNAVTTDMYQFWHLCYETNYESEEIRTLRFFQSYYSSYLPLLKKMKSNYDALAELTKDSPETNLQIRETAKKVDKVRSDLDQTMFAFRSGDTENLNERYHSKAKQLVQFVQDLTSTGLSLSAKYEHEAAALTSDRLSGNRKLTVGVLLFACAANALFCAVLAQVLLRGIIKRLGILQDNSRRLAAGAALNQPIAGHDEIAELDRTFHGMALALEDTARMKQDLVSMLTHDLRSPLTAIQGTLEIIESGVKNVLDTHQKSLFRVAQRNSERMMRLINDLLDIQKVNDGMMTTTPTRICLTELFEEVELSVAAWIADYGIKLLIKDNDLFVLADREKLERIVFNLVSNAIKFSPTGGTITLAAHPFGRMVRVSVSDEGDGIPVEQQEHIFERFQQFENNTERPTVGSGLGLAICQHLIQLHGGKIWVESAPGAGTTFYFTLPVA